MLLSPAGIPTHPAPTTATPPPTPTSQSRRPSQPSDGESTTTTTTTAPTSTAQSPGEGNSRGGVDGRRLQQALIRSVSHDVAGAGGIGGSSGGGSSPERRHGSAADSWDSPGAADKFEAAVQAGTVPDEDGVVHDDPLTDGDDDDDDDRKPQTFKGPLGNGKRMQALYSYMWEAGYSPLGFLRKAGPIGPLMLGKYSTARFGGLAPDEQTALNAYLSNITLLPGSGEYAVGILLRPGAFARFPIAERIHALGKDVPCQFVYGSEDWMDRHGGKDCLRALRKVGNRTSEVAITPEAGHQCVLLLPPSPLLPCRRLSYFQIRSQHASLEALDPADPPSTPPSLQPLHRQCRVDERLPQANSDPAQQQQRRPLPPAAPRLEPRQQRWQGHERRRPAAAAALAPADAGEQLVPDRRLDRAQHAPRVRLALARDGQS
jgi:hypothetical protein